MVVYKAPEWKVLVIQLPSCTPTHHLSLDQVGPMYECQLRSYMSTAVMLFTKKKSDVCTLVTMDIVAHNEDPGLLSYYNTTGINHLAPIESLEEIHCLKKEGSVVVHDAINKTKTVKIEEQLKMMFLSQSEADLTKFQLLVNGKDEICVMQSASTPKMGPHINVHTYSGQWQYKINLDQFGLCSKIKMSCNGAFLVITDSKKLLFLEIKTGQTLSKNFWIPSFGMYETDDNVNGMEIFFHGNQIVMKMENTQTIVDFYKF